MLSETVVILVGRVVWFVILSAVLEEVVLCELVEATVGIGVVDD